MNKNGSRLLDRKNKKAFTLIELIAVLVILAIIALIVTPLVMNIVKKAKDSANKRSVDAYGKAVELAIATHLLDTGDYPTSLDNLTVEYSGNEVVCNVKKLNGDGSVYLSECSVSGIGVKDISTEDGWYHYGKLISNKITYQAYNVGDVITYNGTDFYVIEASDETSDRVTMLKAEPLTVDEVNKYATGHVNMYVPQTNTDYQIAYDNYGYGGMQYYGSLTCGYNGIDWVREKCTTNYGDSEVKYVVDAWANDKFLSGILVKDETGYNARLLTIEDLTNNLGYIRKEEASSVSYVITETTPRWMSSGSYWYWTMSPYEESDSNMWFIRDDGNVSYISVGLSTDVVRPVVTILKSAI